MKGEHFLVVSVPTRLDFRSALDYLYQKCSGQLTGKTVVFSRIFLSDIANQEAVLKKSRIFSFLPECSCSIVGQPPADLSQVAILVYFLDAPLKNYQLVYQCNQIAKVITGSSFDQTRQIFKDYCDTLAAKGQTLLANSLRTWVFVRDIDNNYGGMVKARKELFESEGLTPRSRYLASTGIEAQLDDPKVLVSMDAVSLYPLQTAQIVRMEARRYLNPTYEYGVTFERGTEIIYGDRAHLYISGTASINSKGEIVHPFDVERQTVRAITNVSALLSGQGAILSDMKYLIVYLRNLADVPSAEKIIRSKFVETPVIFAQGAVCRPNWLVEIEGEAIIPTESRYLPFS